MPSGGETPDRARASGPDRLHDAAALAAVLRSLPDAVLVLEADGAVRWANTQAERLFGRTLADTVGTPAFDHVHPDDVTLVLHRLAVVGRRPDGDLGELVEVRVRTPQGWRLVEALGCRVEAFGPGCAVFILRDATDRRRFEVAWDDMAKFRTLLQNSASVTMLVSPERTIESASAALTRLYGHDSLACEGRPFAELFVAEDAERLRQAFDAAEHAPPNPVTVTAGCRRHVSGEAVPTDVTVVSLLDDPTVHGFVVSMQDVTGRRLLEEEAEKDRRRLREAQEVAQLGTFEMNVADRTIYWSPSYRRLIGVEDNDEPVTLDDFLVRVHPEDRARVAREFAEAAGRRDGSFETTCAMAPPGGPVRWLQIRSRGAYDAEGNLAAVLGTAIDVTDRHTMEAARREAEQRFRLAYEHGAVASAMLDLDGVVTSVNPALCRWLGYTPDELVGHPAPGFIHPDDQDMLATRALWVRGEQTPLERRFRRSDGSYAWGLVSAVLVRDDEGAPAYVYAQVQDVTERKRAQQALEHMAFHDPLTGLPNRRLLLDRLEGAIARAHRRGSQLAVIFSDVDRFKLVNDTLGHAVGDRLLVELAGRLRNLARASDTVGRLGGDEFVMVCEDVDPVEGAVAIGRRMSAAFDHPFHVGGRNLSLSLSSGIVFPGPGDDAAACFRNGDIAMYRAKALGGGRSEQFTPDMLSPVAHQLDLEMALRQALKSGALTLAYQPIIDLGSGAPVAVEALCRWRHPERGEISPSEFIPAAERAGLLASLGRFVIHEAVAQIGRWRRELPGGHGLWVSVNVSASQLTHELVEQCEALLAAGAEPGSFGMEITESAFMTDVDAAIGVLRRLRDLEVPLVIDDFGTGYSSLEYLRLLPVHWLKIDQSFVSGVGGADDSATSIVRAVVAMADALGLGSCAEGVETEEQRRALVALGCPTAQGYLWAPALAPGDFEQWFGDRRPAGEAARPGVSVGRPVG